MGNSLLLWRVLVIIGVVAVYSNAQDINQDQRPANPASQPPPKLVNLKHHRYKSLRGNISTSSTNNERTSSPTTTHHHVINVVHPEAEEEELIDELVDHHGPHNPHHQAHFKSPRSGLQLQKAPPDLQFGLAFTVPFVSLSTEKLLHTVSGKNFDSVSSLLKLNFSGLILAAVVGIVAIAGLFLPTILGPGGLGGWGSGPSWLNDGFLSTPHFTGEQYNDYETGWGKNNNGASSGWNSKGGEFLGRSGRMVFGNKWVGVLNNVRAGVETCVVERVCNEVKSGNKTANSLIEVVNEISDNELVQGVGVVKTLKDVVGGDHTACGKIKSGCKENSVVNSGVELITDMLKGWG